MTRLLPRWTYSPKARRQIAREWLDLARWLWRTLDAGLDKPPARQDVTEALSIAAVAFAMLAAVGAVAMDALH